MNITQYINNLQYCKNYLTNSVHKEEFQLLLNSLDHLIEQVDEMQEHILEECHFAQSFVNIVQQDDFTLEDCMLLQEDLTLIFRCKLLKLGKKNMHKTELALLEHFEHTLIEDDYDTVKAKWYYLILPVYIHQEIFKESYASENWTKWWDYTVKSI